jgi:hypothetical protein
MRYRSVVILAAAAMASLAGRAAQAQVGSEFKINVYTTGTQSTPVVSSTPDGRFVVVWGSNGQDGSNYGIFGRRYDSKGNPRGSEFQVNSYTTNQQRFPKVATAADGSFVVVWASLGQDGDGYGIFGQRYDPVGSPLGTEFRVNTYTTSFESTPDVAITGTGFVVVWSGIATAHAQRFDSTGLPVGSEFQVDTYGVTDKFGPSVAAAADGSFIVAWASNLQDGDVRGVYARRFDPAGTPIGGELQVNTYTPFSQTNPHIGVAPDGRFVVAWSSNVQDGDNYGAFAQRFDASGAPQGTEFKVNAYTTNLQRVGGVSTAANGDFVIAWDSDGQDYSNYAVEGRRYDATGTPKAPEFQVNLSTGGSQRYSNVTSAANGRFVVVWTSDADADFSTAVIGRRLAATDLIFADGFESGDLSAWTSASTDGGNLAATAGAALNGTSQGLRALVNDTNSLFVEDDTPASETRYRVRFYLDPNGFDPGEADGHLRVRLLLAQDNLNQRLITIVLKRSGGQYSVEARVRLNDGNRVDTPFIDITDAPHAIEFDWQRAGSAETADGTFELFIDGISVATLSGLDDGGSAVEYVRMGVFSVKTGAAGTLFLDQFVSRRRTFIGL